LAKKSEDALTRKDLDAFVDRRPFNVAVVEEVGRTVRWLIAFGAAIAFFHYLTLIMSSLAGKTTTANVVLNMLGSLNFSSSLAWAGTVSAVAYGAGQKSLRKRTVNNLHAHIRELETRLDPNRTSSELATTGETNPKDQ